jgi:hypothetical protein
VGNNSELNIKIIIILDKLVGHLNLTDLDDVVKHRGFGERKS